MNKRTFNQFIAGSNFRELFISEMGWNNPRGQAWFDLTIESETYHYTQIAERSGFQVLTCEVREIPTSSLCKKIDTRLRRQANDYICIYLVPGSEHHLWVVPVKKVEKRDLVLVEYETAEKAGFLFEKMDELTFGLDERTTIMDVKERVQAGFIVNSEKITKDFYTGFRKEHTNFAKFISGIDDEITDLKKNRNKQWYTSVMLNRLMFCYFIQKKGFLDRNVNYLRDKLAWVKNEKGENRFFGTFYQGFLVSLFHEGLNSPRHQQDFVQKYGRIPYLNGGMFSIHELEEQYPALDIADEAFESLFAFFDQWHWHLDDRLTASGKDINPDVLGYIFEQYINDRAQMGAYYTKEDITEYIGRNTILPYLMDATLGTLKSSKVEKLKKVWQFLKESGDTYIFDAVKKGKGLEIPKEIAVGIDISKPNLLERRSHWNEKTPEAFALPTEIWRETIERLQRYQSIKSKIESGEIKEINDFITYNLDIRQFVQDLLAQTDDHLLVKHFYAQLRKVTILDPTCGSGAFLFAALNILEPLYEICIDRMQGWNDENPNLFKEELEELNGRYRSNIRYFIYKNIILRNLYGVDIMVEATEIAKLRLFLKMVAVVDVDRRDPNLGLDPLSDIDFNIRCGNTLVGYATEKEMEDGVKYMDMFARQEFEDKVYQEMDIVSRAYETFKKVQLTQDADLETFRQAKKQLKERLKALNELLNQNFHKATSPYMDYNKWKASHQPFHWLAEYYDIINGNGGFDVVIGNPPYVEYNKRVQGVAVSDIYKLYGYKSIDCGNLYAYCIERGTSLISNQAKVGWIVPISVICTERTNSIQTYLNNEYGRYISSFDIFPAKLFEGAAQRVSILIMDRKKDSLHTSKYYRWLQSERNTLFANITYADNSFFEAGWTPRVNTKIQNNLLGKIEKQKRLSTYFTNRSNVILYIHRIINNFIKAIDFEPYFKKSDGTITHSEDFKTFFCMQKDKELLVDLLNSSTFYWYWRSHGDGFHCGYRDIYNFHCTIENITNKCQLKEICVRLINDFKNNSEIRIRRQKSTGDIFLQTFFITKSKPIIDEIDKVLAKHYGFTEEELDFIINYDIKYRMGDELSE